jgi:very-short-patch-repair endonuclease
MADGTLRDFLKTRQRTPQRKRRASLSELEEALWVQFKGAGLAARCVREYVFAPPRRWRFDFCFLHASVAIECEGAVFVQGRHNRGAGMTADLEKYNMAAEMGFIVLRYDLRAIKSGVALAQIERVLRQSGRR